MKRTLFLFFTICSLSTQAQNFSVDPVFYDSTGSGSYNVHFTGQATFNDSMQIFYSVKTTDSIPQLLFSDSVDFRMAEPSIPGSFLYNPSTSAFSIAFGNFPTVQLILELYSVIGNVTREHIYVNIHNFETAINNEE